MFISGKETKEILGISDTTLRQWSASGYLPCIRTQGGHRRYCKKSIDSIIGKTQETSKSRTKYIYCRVSTHGQKDDLQRQIQSLQSIYPEHSVISDIGSGINFKRKGLKTILELSMSGNLEELVVAHRDRLARFATELITWVICRNGGRVVYHDQTEQPIPRSPEMDLTEDLLAIITDFSARAQGRRRYRSKNNEGQNLSYMGAETVDDSNNVQVQSSKESSYSSRKRRKIETL
jgi:predicted site-specific integrase-resolvase